MCVLYIWIYSPEAVSLACHEGSKQVGTASLIPHNHCKIWPYDAFLRQMFDVLLLLFPNSDLHYLNNGWSTGYLHIEGKSNQLLVVQKLNIENIWVLWIFSYTTSPRKWISNYWKCMKLYASIKRSVFLWWADTLKYNSKSRSITQFTHIPQAPPDNIRQSLHTAQPYHITYFLYYLSFPRQLYTVRSPVL